MESLEEGVAGEAGEALGSVTSATEQLESDCASLVEKTDTAYEDARAHADDAAGELLAAAQGAVEEAAAAAEAAALAIEDATSLAVEHAAPACEGALDDVLSLLEEAVAACGDLEPLVPELDASQTVVGTIDKMLQAME
jgi:hypothetical protein